MSTVTTAVELDALPVGSVVLGSEHNPYGRAYEKQECDGEVRWYGTGSGQPYSPYDFYYPLTVLYRPDQQPTAQPSVDQVAAAARLGWFGFDAFDDDPSGRWMAAARAVLALFESGR